MTALTEAPAPLSAAATDASFTMVLRVLDSQGDALRDIRDGQNDIVAWANDQNRTIYAQISTLNAAVAVLNNQQARQDTSWQRWVPWIGATMGCLSIIAALLVPALVFIWYLAQHLK